MPLAELEQGSQVAARLSTLRCTAFLPLLSDSGELCSSPSGLPSRLEQRLLTPSTVAFLCWVQGGSWAVLDRGDPSRLNATLNILESCYL